MAWSHQKVAQLLSSTHLCKKADAVSLVIIFKADCRITVACKLTTNTLANREHDNAIQLE